MVGDLLQTVAVWLGQDVTGSRIDRVDVLAENRVTPVVLDEGTEDAAEWAQLAPLLLGDGRPGDRWSDHRTVNGILFRLRTGMPWREVSPVA